MNHGLRFQVLVIPNVPWAQYLDRFVRLEALGIDVAAVPDHFCDWGNPSGPWLEAWTGIAAIAAHTSTIRLTTCVTQIPLRNPAVLAHQAVTVDHISGGRLEFGLGAAWHEAEHRGYGIPFPSAGERIAILDEALRVIKALWTEDTASFDGQHFRLEDAICNPKPVQKPHPPVLLGGSGPKVLDRVLAYADEWTPNRFGTPDELKVRVDELRERAGRHVRVVCSGVKPERELVESLEAIGVDGCTFYVSPEADAGEAERQLDAFAALG